MVVANVLYLSGPVVEAIIKPRPVEAYRRHAWIMGFGASVASPLIVATIFALSIGWPANVG